LSTLDHLYDEHWRSLEGGDGRYRTFREFGRENGNRSGQHERGSVHEPKGPCDRPCLVRPASRRRSNLRPRQKTSRRRNYPVPRHVRHHPKPIESLDSGLRFGNPTNVASAAARRARSCPRTAPSGHRERRSAQRLDPLGNLAASVASSTSARRCVIARKRSPPGGKSSSGRWRGCASQSARISHGLCFRLASRLSRTRSNSVVLQAIPQLPTSAVNQPGRSARIH